MLICIGNLFTNVIKKIIKPIGKLIFICIVVYHVVFSTIMPITSHSKMHLRKIYFSFFVFKNCKWAIIIKSLIIFHSLKPHFFIGGNMPMRLRMLLLPIIIPFCPKQLI